MLEIRTNQLKTRKKVLIDDHEYTVRRFGNIEQLDISQYMRRLNKLDEIEKAQKQLTEIQIKEVEDISNKLSKIFVSLFDDGGDGSKARALVASMSEQEMSLMMAEIFNEGTDAEVS